MPAMQTSQMQSQNMQVHLASMMASQMVSTTPSQAQQLQNIYAHAAFMAQQRQLHANVSPPNAYLSSTVPQTSSVVPQSQGVVPQPQGAIPQPQGVIPQSQGVIPQPQGVISQTQTAKQTTTLLNQAQSSTIPQSPIIQSNLNNTPMEMSPSPPRIAPHTNGPIDLKQDDTLTVPSLKSNSAEREGNLMKEETSQPIEAENLDGTSPVKSENSEDSTTPP